MKKPNFKYILAASASFITFGVYFASLQNQFVEWDDSQYIFENPYIRSFDADFFRWAFFDFYAANWHPLTWISHALDYAVWGLNPLGHHLTNNILHAVNTFLVVLLVARLLELASPESPVPGPHSPFTPHDSLPSGKSGTLPNDPGKRPYFPSSNSPFTSHVSRFTLIAAGVTGLLFGLHPLHVESVAWVAERKDLLCALFYLLSILAYIAYAKGDRQGAIGKGQGNQADGVKASPSNYRKSYLLSLSFFLLALMSKPMAVSLPVVLLILDWYPLGRITSFATFRASCIGKLPFFALSIVSSVLTVLAQQAGGSITAIEAIPLSTRMLVAANSLVAYLWKMLVPLNLIPYYPYPKEVALLSAEYLLAMVLAVAITVVCIVMLKKQERLFLSVWAYYVITLLPVLGLVQVGGQSMADRYTYLPSLGPFLLIGLLVAWGAERLRKQTPVIAYSAPATVIFLLLFISSLSVKQMGVWQDSFTLWSNVIEKEPETVPIAYNNRGRAYYGKGQLDQAIEDFNKAIILDPVSPKAYLNRGAALTEKGQLGQAAADFDKAIALNAYYYEAYNAKGSLLGISGYLDHAIEQFDKAIEINPGYSAAYVNRGSVYAMIGQNTKALEDLDRAIQLDRYYAENYIIRGNLYLAIGNKELAVSDFRRACDLGNKSGCSSLQSVNIMTTNQGK